MDRTELEALLTQPETLKQILGDYRGPFSIGITKSNKSETTYKLLLVVNTEHSNFYKDFVDLDGTKIPLEVHGGLQEMDIYK